MHFNRDSSITIRAAINSHTCPVEMLQTAIQAIRDAQLLITFYVRMFAIGFISQSKLMWLKQGILR